MPSRVASQTHGPRDGVAARAPLERWAGALLAFRNACAEAERACVDLVAGDGGAHGDVEALEAVEGEPEEQKHPQVEAAVQQRSCGREVLGDHSAFFGLHDVWRFPFVWALRLDLGSI